jgi:hypothetical protein
MLVLLVATVAACDGEVAGTAQPDPPGDIFNEVPADLDPADRYLIYLHGAIIETEGIRPTHPDFGVYEYREILETFADRGLVVISKARPAGTDGMAYASKVVDQVRSLSDAGVPGHHITVVGFSKGGGIAIVASAMLMRDDVNFVFMAACAPWLDDHPEIVARGKLLSLYEASDHNFGSCGSLFDRDPNPLDNREMMLEVGGGHGAFYQPRPQWVEPVLEWVDAAS